MSAAPPTLRTLAVVDPSTGTVTRSFEAAEADEVAEAVRRARSVQPAWAAVPLRRRALLLQRIRDHLLSDMDFWARQISQETGKPIRDAYQAELIAAVGALDFAARMGPKALATRRYPMNKGWLMGLVTQAVWQPRGVVALITPWNYPLAISVSGLSAALMAGNTVVFKPSELTPGLGEALASLINTQAQRLGLPDGLVQVVLGDGETGRALVAADVDHIVFTGSTAVGQAIQASAVARGVSITLELGGSDPMIVLPGAPLETVASYALWGRLVHAGQTCSAVKRLLVPRAILPAMADLLAREMAQLRVGPPLDPTTQMGPLMSAHQREQVHAQVADAVARGARVITGGELPPGPGFYYPPTLLVEVPPDARVLTEEVFGPVLPIVPYDTLTEAIALANQMAYGLSASVFGPVAEARRVAAQLQAGQVTVNALGMTLYGLPSIPWQGWKASGVGASHGVEGLQAMARPQTLTENVQFAVPGLAKPPWHFARTPDRSLWFTRGLVRAFGPEDWASKLCPGLLAGIASHNSQTRR